MPERRSHILVCDSPGLLLEETVPVLRELGYDCSYVPDPEQLLGARVEPDLVLVSSALKGGARGSAFRNLRRTHARRPLLVMAHVRSLSTAIDFFRAGADDYLPAPMEREELAARLREAARRSRSTVPPADTDAFSDRSGERPGAAPPPPRERSETETDAGRNAPPRAIAVEELGCALLVCSADGKLLECNSAALSLFNQPDPEHLATALLDPGSHFQPVDRHGRSLPAASWPPTEAARVKAAREALIGIRRPDRSRVWLHLHSRPLLARGRVTRVVTTAVNLTEEQRRWKKNE